MKVYDLFSKRKRDESLSGKAELFQFHEIPENLRRQLRKIAQDGIGKPVCYEYGPTKNSVFVGIHKVLCREYGVDWLMSQNYDPYEDLMAFMLSCTVDQFIDCVELTSKGMRNVTGEYSAHEKAKWDVGNVDDLLDEINYRFRRAGCGFQLVGTKVIKADSHLLYSEVTKPALDLLNRPGFDGPQQEFLDAYGHFKDGNYREAIADASNAFESAMKAVCEIKGWDYPSNPRASDLIKVLKRNGLFPDYLDKSFDQLLATLTSGLPQVRDSSAAHGQGATVVDVPEFVAAYSLHLAAAKIVLIVSAAK